MRKYGRWMLALGIMAVSPAVSNAQVSGQQAVATGQRTAQAPVNQNQQMAERIADGLRKAQLQAVEGVSRVDNRLQVMEEARPIVRQPVQAAAFNGQQQPVQQVAAAAGPSNQQVAEGIASALTSAGLQGYDVEIRYQNGTAVLAGSVATPQQKALAEQVTAQVPGVQSVANQLRIEVPVQRTAFNGAGGLPTGPAGPMPGMNAPGMPGQPMGPMAGPMGGMPGPMAQPMPGPSPMGHGGMGGAMYGSPNLPDHAWPAYAQYPNSAAVTYPTQYSASAWPYIGPYYPYPQVPLGWRKAQLEWDDGYWQLSFNNKTDKWWWFMQPKNW